VAPRAVKALEVQHALLRSGSTLIQRWYADVPWGTPLWRATQLLSLQRIMDRPGAIDRDNNIPLGARAKWGVEETVSAAEREEVLERLKSVTGQRPSIPHEVSRAADFALAAARHLLSGNEP
jgi:hypothetical protein